MIGALRLSDKDVNELRGLAERLTKGHESLAVARWHLYGIHLLGMFN